MLSLTTICLAFASAAAALSFPESFPIQKRQDLTPGSPLYECHAHCGGVIVDAGTAGYCDNSTYTTDLADCLECALTYDIWQYYGTDVAAAAEACGDADTPSPSSAVATAASTSGTAATSSVAATTSTIETTSAPAATSSASAVSAMSSTTASSAIASVASSSAAAAATYTGAAASMNGGKIDGFVAAAIAVAALGMA